MAATPPTVYTHRPIPGFADLPHFNIRNGNPEAAVSLLIKPTIAVAFRWIMIDDLPPNKAMEYADAIVMEHYNHLVSAPPTGWDNAKCRKAAILLGISRAVTTKFYELQITDIIPGERQTSVLRYRAPVAAVGDTPAIPEALEIKTGTTAEVATRMNTVPEYTELERAAMVELIAASIGILPVQGYSLVNTQHHYLSDPKGLSFKAFRAIEKQCFLDARVAEFFSTDEDMVRDTLWHKSCHPVNLTIKDNVACNEATKEMLVKAGAGAAASRLPATEPGVRAGEAYCMLFATLKPFFEMFSGGIDHSHLLLALRTVKRLLPGTTENPDTAGRDPEIPRWVVDRKTAGKWVAEIVQQSQPIAAHCFGFYIAMSDAGMALGTGQNVDSLRNAHSLKKLASTHVPSYFFGFQQYSDYVVAKNKLRQKAQFEAPIFEIPKVT